jgi:Tfp pilus assembly protein PilV
VEVVLAALIVAAAVLGAARMIIASPSRDVSPQDSAKIRQLQLLTLFAPGIAAAADDPRALLVWQPLASTARALFPDEFAAMDRAAGAPFPFSRAQLESAHAKWSADWLGWEQTHDSEYKLKAAAAEEELRHSGGAAVQRSRLESVEREKLDRYQRRYEEYTRVSKGLKNLMAQ